MNPAMQGILARRAHIKDDDNDNDNDASTSARPSVTSPPQPERAQPERPLAQPAKPAIDTTDLFAEIRNRKGEGLRKVESSPPPPPSPTSPLNPTLAGAKAYAEEREKAQGSPDAAKDDVSDDEWG